MPLEVGDPAPDIRAPNQHGEIVEPSLDGPTVLYFYPRDNTPGCTTEAKQFSKEHETYREAGVTVYGVSTDDVDSHRRFAENHDITIDLLADPDGEIANAYDVPTRSSGTTERMTYVIDDGAVIRVYPSVKPDGHARDILMDLLDDEIVHLSF